MQDLFPRTLIVNAWRITGADSYSKLRTETPCPLFQIKRDKKLLPAYYLFLISWTRDKCKPKFHSETNKKPRLLCCAEEVIKAFYLTKEREEANQRRCIMSYFHPLKSIDIMILSNIHLDVLLFFKIGVLNGFYPQTIPKK